MGNLVTSQFIIGTTDLNGDALSISSSPRVHPTFKTAQVEATRLVTSQQVPMNRKCVILEVRGFVRVNSQPVIFE